MKKATITLENGQTFTPETGKHLKTCQKLYERKGPSAVYDYCNKADTLYHHCAPCEADTPTISNTDGQHTCALCGQSKSVPTT